MGEIAIDTCNMPLNRLKAERSLIGRRATETEFRSYGQLIWEYFLVGCEIKDPDLAKRLKEARLQRFAKSSTLLLVGVAAVFQSTFWDSDFIRTRTANRPQSLIRVTVRRSTEA